MRLVELSSNVKRISSEVPEDAFLKLLKGEARNAYDAIKRQPIYTKVETKDPFFVVEPSKATRKSKFIIDSLTPLLPSWQGWKSRLECVRGWTSKALADSRGAGSLCLLIPIDSARVHVATNGSFYRSFEQAHKLFEVEKIDNEALCGWLQSVHAVAKLAAPDDVGAFVEPETAQQFIRELEKLDKHRVAVSKLKEDELKQLERIDVRRAFNAYKQKNLVESLSRLLDPDDNGMQTFTSLYNLPDNREIWTGGKCLVIKLDEYEAMHKRGVVK